MNAEPMLSHSVVSADGKWEGWCWYPDQPQERAVVEVFVGSRSLRAVRAARLRTDIRDLGMGDGYCGWQLLLPLKEHLFGHAFVEVRERRFGRVIGRVIFSEDGRLKTRETRLNSAAELLRAAGVSLTQLSRIDGRRAAPLEELGAMLSHWPADRRGETMDSSQRGALAVALSRISVVPSANVGCHNPRVSLVVRASDAGSGGDITVLAAELRALAAAMQSVDAEIILLDDGARPLASLLPGRLRHLRLVRSSPGLAPGAAFNAAALACSGAWLALVRTRSMAFAPLLEAVRFEAGNTVYIDSSLSDPQALMARTALLEMGGLDTQLEAPALWEDFLHRATLTGQRIVRWQSRRECGLHRAVSGAQRHG